MRVYSAPAQKPRTIISTTQTMDGSQAFSRKTIQHEKSAKPTYRSTSETMPHGMDIKRAPSTEKLPTVNPYTRTAVIAIRPISAIAVAIFMEFLFMGAGSWLASHTHFCEEM